MGSDSATADAPAPSTATDNDSNVPNREALEASVFDEDDGYSQPGTKDWTETDGLDQDVDPATLMKGDKPSKPEADENKDRLEKDDSPGDESEEPTEEEDSDVGDEGKGDDPKPESSNEKDPIEVAEARVKAAQFDLHRKNEKLKETEKSLSEKDKTIKELEERLSALESKSNNKESESKADQSDLSSLNVDELNIDDGAKEYLKDMLDDEEGRMAVQAIIEKASSGKEKETDSKAEGENVDNSESGHSKEKFQEVMNAFDDNWATDLNSDEFNDFVKEQKDWVNSELEKGEEYDPIPVIRVLKKFKSVSGKKTKKPPVDSSPRGTNASSPPTGDKTPRSRKSLEQEVFNDMD